MVRKKKKELESKGDDVDATRLRHFSHTIYTLAIPSNYPSFYDASNPNHPCEPEFTLEL